MLLKSKIRRKPLTILVTTKILVTKIQKIRKRNLMVKTILIKIRRIMTKKAAKIIKILIVTVKIQIARTLRTKTRTKTKTTAKMNWSVKTKRTRKNCKSKLRNYRIASIQQLFGLRKPNYLACLSKIKKTKILRSLRKIHRILNY